MYKVIMAPTEGSDSEKDAIAVAAKLARRFGADLHLVRVLAAPLVSDTVPRQPVLEITEQALEEERLARLRKLEALGAELRSSAGTRVITALEDGRVAPTLRDYTTKFDVDLIVMSSHSRGGLKRVTLGSVTDYLIRNTHTPVLVVKQPASFAAGLEGSVARIVVPLDGSALAEQILPEVAALASGLNATVSLIQVLTPVTYSQEQIMQPGLPWWDAEIAAANSYLAKAAGQLTEKGIDVSEDVILSDNVATAILDYAARMRADLIAIATSGSGGMARLVFGTVSDEVTRKSPTSLLVLRPLPEKAVNATAGASNARELAGA
ncbi:MAG: universal stress protein [Gemmatimonadaceae bacterium]